MSPECRHCGGQPASRSRGLCWRCYRSPDIRTRYPSTSKLARRGVDDFYGRVVMPSAPTGAVPGTPEKVAVLEQRARLHQSLWHPLDAPGMEE